MSQRQTPLQIEADLLADTGEPRLSGPSHGGASPRQLLFRAGDLYLGLSLHSPPGSAGLALIGQLTADGNASRNLAGLPVTADGASGVAARTTSNRLGEFLLTGVAVERATLGISLDRWTSLKIRLPDAALPGEDR